MTQAIKDFIAAGEKATQGDLYLFCAHPGNNNNEYRVARPSKQKGYYKHVEVTSEEREGNARFFTLAANARADIKAMYELMEEMAEALESVVDDYDSKGFGGSLYAVLTKFNAMKG